MEEEDFNRPPESSDEEDSQKAQNDLETGDYAPTRGPSPPLKRKRAETTMPPRQSKRTRGRLQDTKPDLSAPSTASAQPTLQVHSRVETEFEMFTSQSQSQSQKRRQKTYAGRKKNGFKPYQRAPTPVDDADGPKSLEVKQTILEESESAPKPVLNLDKTRPTEEQEAQPVLKTYNDVPQFDIGSSASTATSDAQITDLRSSPVAVRVPRSHSASSITSVSSHDHENSPSAKPTFRSYDDFPTVPCPVCHTQIDKSLLPDIRKGLRSLSLQKQQDVCFQHRLSEAKSQAERHGYPTVDWEDVEKARIPGLMKHLRQVLLRKTGCFYLDQLDKQVASSKGKPKALRSYLHTQVLEIAKPGYYGPKGETVMAHVITQSLAEDLRKVSRTDKAVSPAGVGPYVAAVLVPECTMRLVMQDMETKNQMRAREILAESTDIGRLLNPDDDHVQMFDQT